MSLWVRRQDKDGKRILWQIDFDPMIILVVIGLIAAFIGPVLFQNPSIIKVFPFGLLCAGLVCIIISKISLYKKGTWFSFGAGLMTKSYAKLYKIGYLIIGAGTLLLLVLYNAMRGT